MSTTFDMAAIAAKLDQVSGWSPNAFVIEPLNAMCVVTKTRSGYTLEILNRSKSLSVVHGDTPEQLAEAFIATMSLLFVTR